MGHFNDWLFEHEARQDGVRKDKAGGLVPLDLKRAEHADLITLPVDVQGTNCSNCKFVRPHGGLHECGHPDLDGVPVNERMCCKYWDNKGAVRHFRKGGRGPQAG